MSLDAVFAFYRFKVASSLSYRILACCLVTGFAHAHKDPEQAFWLLDSILLENFQNKNLDRESVGLS